MSLILTITKLLITSNLLFSAEEKNVEKLSLKDAIARTIKESHDIRENKEYVYAREERLKSSFSVYLPKVYIEGVAGTNKDRQLNPGDVSPPLASRDYNHYQGDIVLSQNIFAGFGDEAERRLARVERDLAFLTLKESSQTETLKVIDLYFSIQLLRLQIKVENEIKKLKEKRLAEIEDRFAKGRSTELELLESQYNLAAQSSQILSLQTDLEDKNLDFARLVNIPIDRDFELTDDLVGFVQTLGETPPPKFSQAFEQALTSSSALQRANFELEKIVWQNRKSEAKYLPRVDFEVIYGSDAYLRRDFLTRDSMTYKAQLRLSIPIFSGLSSFSDREASISEQRAQKEKAAKYREDVLKTLNREYRKFDLASSQIKSETMNLKYAQKGVGTAESLFHAGRVTSTQLFDSYSRQLAAQKSLAKAQFDRITSLAKIKMFLNP